MFSSHRVHLHSTPEQRDWRIATVTVIFKKALITDQSLLHGPTTHNNQQCLKAPRGTPSTHRLPTWFRARRGCETQLLTLAHELESGFDKKHQYDLIILDFSKVSKGAKIRNRYNQVPHLTQDTNGKVTNTQ